MTSLLSHLALRPLDLPEMSIGLIVVWMLFVGGAIGSFMNVVVYRVPLGLSIVRPGSHCPRCKHPIRARDNVPVVGWLLLRGRCRACRLPISPRYPLVELVFALMLALLAWCEPLSAGATLPIESGPLAEHYPLAGMTAYHFALLCGLTGAALMALDRAAAPLSYWFIVGLVGLGPPLLWPLLRPVPMPQLDAVPYAPLIGLLEGLTGAAVGLVMGVAALPAAALGAPGRSGLLTAAAGSAVVGAYLGWQAAAGIGLAAVIAWTVWQLLRAGRRGGDLPWPLFLAIGTLAWIPAWRIVVDRGIVFGARWFGADAPWYVPVAAAACTFGLALAGRASAEKEYSP